MKQLNITRNRTEYLIKDLKFNYDKLNDLLYVYKEDSSVYSNVMIGEFHLEFSKEDELVGVEILKASELLSEYGISKDIIENIKGVNLKVIARNNSLLVFMMIYTLNQEKCATITLNNLEAPMMHVITST